MTNAQADVTTTLALPKSRKPTGWFQVGWTDELGNGQLKLVHYFDQDIVIFRGESGALHALDAHCLHLGGNIGVNGTVCGDEVQCPWHGWRWDGEGRNTLIPYSEQRCKQNLRIRTWEIREFYGGILIWHDVLDRAPLWEPPLIPELETGEYHIIPPANRVVHKIKAHPQMPMENSADLFHVPFIHGNGAKPEMISFEPDGHWIHAALTIKYGAGKKSTWLTPEGELSGVMRYNIWGVCNASVHWPDEILGAIQIGAVTPIDDTYCDYWFAMTVKKTDPDSDAPTGLEQKMIDHQLKIIEQDFFTWEHMKVLAQPNFAVEEASNYAAFRRWARQFYPDTYPEVQS